LKLNIVLILALLFSLFACSGDETTSSDKQVGQKIVKKNVAKKTRQVDEVEDNREVSLDSDFEEEKDKDADSLDINNEEEVDETTQNDEEVFNTRGRIKKIEFEPKVIRADSDIIVSAYIVPGPLESETILYTFTKNGEVIVFEKPDKVLKKGLFVKGDLIAVNVMIVKGSDVKEERKTELNKVANSNPEITKLPSISVAGYKTYTYTVEAKDIDKDSITFELEGDIPPGMSIDLYTGKITYNFTQKPENDSYHRISVNRINSNNTYYKIYIQR